MKKIKRALYIGLAIAIAGLLCIQAGAITNMSTYKTENPSGNSIIPSGYKKLPFEVKQVGQTERTTACSGGNVLISIDSQRDDYLPSITRDGNGNVVVGWTHDVSMLDADPGLAYSTDSGDTWTVKQLVTDGFQKYFDQAYVEGSRYDALSGTFDGIFASSLDVINEAVNMWTIPDVTDDTTWAGYYTSEGTMPGGKYCVIVDNSYYEEHSFSYTGPVVFYIDAAQGITDEWMLYWNAADMSGYVQNWDAESALDTAPAQDPDFACIHDDQSAWTEGDFFYAVAQHNREDNGRSEIVYKRCIPVDEDDIEYVAEQYYLVNGDTFDAAHPGVAATGDKVVVVYMINDNDGGDWDIKCSYSSDHGQTWGTSVIANEPQIDELYPAVYMSGDSVHCAYIKQGNLYLVKSEDAGATWGTPEKINDVDGTVVEEENSVCIHPAGIVWTDNRDGNKDIYFVGGESAPNVVVKSISGGFGVSAVIANEGNADATNVQWSIDLEGGLVLVGKHADGTIPTLAAGASQTVKIGFVLGFGGVTITVAADTASKTASGTVLGPFVIGVS